MSNLSNIVMNILMCLSCASPIPSNPIQFQVLGINSTYSTARGGHLQGQKVMTLLRKLGTVTQFCTPSYLGG